MCPACRKWRQLSVTRNSGTSGSLVRGCVASRWVNALRASFFTGVVSEWALDLPSERFLEIFRDWPIGPYPGTVEVLAEVKRFLQIGCLRNTNKMHWEHHTALWPMLDTFDFRFLSFELDS
jgi:hypothetical protein